MSDGTYITLKWGTIKSFNFSGSDRGKELLKEYREIGLCVSAACQHNTPRQKEIICELIDLSDGDTIFLEWDGKEVSKREAKDYVRNCGKKKKRSKP